MKKLAIILFFLFMAVVSKGQDVVKFDYYTYNGTPIKKGWLITDEAYKKLYLSYNAADSLISYFEKYDAIIKKYDSLNLLVPKQYEDRLKDRDGVIEKQQKTIGSMETLLNQSNDEHKKIQRSFIKIGKSRIHIGTAIKVGLSFGVMGYLIGLVN